MTRFDVTSLMLETRLLAIVRSATSILDDMPKLLPAVQEAGLKLMEVTLNTPKALETISWAAKNKKPGITFGAGTVTTVEEAKSAIGAGAEFLVCPTLDVNVIAEANKAGVAIFPGCLTPTEVITAHYAGADLVKVFPCSCFGPGYIKDVLAPLSNLKVIAVGGITLDNFSAYLSAGASGVGVGSALISEKLIKDKSGAEISAHVRTFVSAVSGN